MATISNPRTGQVFRYFVNLSVYDTLKRLRNYRGFAGGAGLKYEDILSTIGKIDLDKLNDAQKKGLAHILNNFDTAKGLPSDTVAFFKSSGATFEVLDIVKHIDQIADIQKTIPITSPSGLNLKRVYDYVLKDGWNVDKKAWSPAAIQGRIKQSMKADLLIPGEETTGQIFRDIIAAQKGIKVRWSFDARSNGVLTPAQIKEMVEKAALNEFPSLAKAFKLNPKDYEKIATKKKFIDDILENFDIEIGDF